MALWILITPTLLAFCAAADNARPSPRAGIANVVLFTADSSQDPGYFGGAAGLGAGVIGRAGAGFAAGGGVLVAAAGAFLSYRSMMSLVMSMVFDAYSTGVCGLLTSRTSE